MIYDQSSINSDDPPLFNVTLNNEYKHAVGVNILFDPDVFWGEILSRDAERVRAAFNTLDDETERAAVMRHLRRMVSEDGWAEPQRASAQAALTALDENSRQQE